MFNFHSKTLFGNKVKEPFHYILKLWQFSKKKVTVNATGLKPS